MSRAHLTIAYDGPALRDHVMDVKDLAPAMLGMGQLFDAANSALNGDAAHVKVQVKATEIGCFQITFEVVQSLDEHLANLLTGLPITAAVNLVSGDRSSIDCGRFDSTHPEAEGPKTRKGRSFTGQHGSIDGR